MNIPALGRICKEARDYKAEYRDYHGKPSQIKRRAERNAARRKLGLKRGDPREADHKHPLSDGGSNSSRNLRAVSQETNREKGSKVGKDWEESKHPRADNGQFGSGGGKPSQGAKRRRATQARRAEGAAQTTLGGGKAIQSLLSGGSALDKVGWFKQPEKPPAPAQEKPPEAKPPEMQPKKPTARNSDSNVSIRPNVPAFRPVDDEPTPAKVQSAKDTIRENLKSGKLKRETVIAAVKDLYTRANGAEAKGDERAAKDYDLKAKILTEAASIQGELYARGISQSRAKPLTSIGSTIYTGRGPTPPPNPAVEEYLRQHPKTTRPNNSLDTSHKVERYRNKVISQGTKLDNFQQSGYDLALHEFNGKTYLVDNDHPSQFSSMSKDEWRRMKDDLSGDEEPDTISSKPKQKPTSPTQPPKPSTHITGASSSDVLANGKKLDNHGNASLHEYNGGFYVVTENNPVARKISKPAWEGMKYD